MQTRPRSTLALAAALLAVVFVVHAPALAYPYLQEDWEILGEVAHQPFSTAIAHEFGAVHAIHYRPLVASYLIVLNQIVGIEGLLSHVLVLLMLAGASLAVALVVERLTGDRALAALVAVSHAAANVIHLDALMIQTCGVENMGGTLCVFLSVWLFLKSRPVASAALFAIGLLVKETTIVLPGFLLLCALLDGEERATLPARLRATLRRMWPHAMVLIAYLLVKTRGLSPFHLSPSDAYYMSFWGIHLWTNLAAYLRWTLEAILPGLPALYAALLALAVLAAALWRNRARDPRRLLFCAGWFLVGIGPMLILPNHTYRYYLEFALPAALMLWWSALRDILPRRDPASVIVALAMCLAAAVGFRGRVRRGVDLDGSNETIERATTVARVRALLERDCGVVPRGGTLLFDQLQVWSFGKESGPRLWCRNPPISVYDVENLRVGERGELAIVDAATHQGELYTGAHNQRALDPGRTFVVRARENQLVLEPVARYLGER